MNKKEFTNALAIKAGISIKEAGRLIDETLELTKDTLKNGESINFAGWGSLSVKEKPERTVRNPATGQLKICESKKVVKFKPGSALNEAVND